MKCTQCGCEELTISPAPFVGDYFNSSSSLKIYACNKCGHLEFFDNGINEIQQEITSKLKALQIKKEELTREIEKHNRPLIELKNQLQIEQSNLQTLLQNKDVTIRQQEQLSAELKTKIDTLNSEIKRLTHNINPILIPLTTELKKVENEIASLKSKSLNEEYYKRYFIRRGI